MKQTLSIIIIYLMTGLNMATGQKCGYSSNAIDTKRIKKNLQHVGLFEKSQKTYVPIQFIIVSNEFNDGAVKERSVLDALCNVNNYFDSIGIRFYLKDSFKYISSQAIYQQDESGSSGVRDLFNAFKVDDAINIFIGGELATSTSAYYTSSADVIYMDKRYVNGHDVIMAHELGHYFSLRHTFYGWEDTTYEPSEPTPTSIFYRGDFRQVELVDREGNCAEAADLLCDTPSDYITDWDGDCNYTGGAVDPTGVEIDPDERNIMAYYNFTDCSQYIFSQQQIQLMNVDLEERTNLSNLPNPSVETLMSFPSPLYPEDEGFISNLATSEFEWTEVEHADYYIFELSFVPNFTTTVESIFTQETTAVTGGLFEGLTYYWRISAFTYSDPCDVVQSPSYSFTADPTSSIENSLSADFKLYPNPVENGVLFLRCNLSEFYDLVRIYSLSGQLIKSISSIQGNRIDVTDLPSGSYVVNLKKGSEQFSQIVNIN